MKGQTQHQGEATLTLTVKLSYLETEGKKLPEAVAYAFDKSGHLVTSAVMPKQQQSEVELQLPAALRDAAVRVVVGPPLRKPIEEKELPEWAGILARETEPAMDTPTRAKLVRRGAREKSLRLRSATESVEFKLYPPDWTQWLFCPCVVRGRLVKQYKLPDGTTQEMGVYPACVKIYDVDKLVMIILQLPDQDLFRLRAELVEFIRKWPPPPPPPPEAEMVEVGLPRPGPWARTAVARQAVKLASGVSPQVTADVAPGRDQVEAELTSVFVAASATKLRNALVAKADLLKHFVCRLDWLWHWYKIDFIKCTCTDEQGRFETVIWYPCGGDKPDLYFRAVQCINCIPHTVYDPGVICHTYWDYTCGSEVVLVVTDPAAIVCAPPLEVNPPPGVSTWVMPFAVGGIPLPSIKSDGLTDYSDTKTGIKTDIKNAPFGGWLGLRHGWSGAIPLTGANKPFYYRWRYQKDLTSDWSEFHEPVVRHYIKELPGKPPSYPVCTMGPKSVDGKLLYLFKPHKPDHCPDFVPGGNNYWPLDAFFADIYTGYLNTPALPGGVAATAGKYKIKLEVYDQAGNLIAPGAASFQFIVPTVQGPDGTWESRTADSATEIEGEGFVFYVHIDNGECTALIDSPTIGGLAAGDQCGFLRYTPGEPGDPKQKVHIPFHARHPANFATFSFSITRGAGVVSSAAGEVSSPNEEGYTGDGAGNFTCDFPTSTLLGPCTEAAFAEVLNVDAKATNGWTRLEEYDADAVRAFALAVTKGT